MTPGEERLAQFAELLSEGQTPKQAGFEVWGNPETGNAMLQRIRRRLGPQAV